MREARCSICGREDLRQGHGTEDTDTYTLTFKTGVCKLCRYTLTRALGGITDLLRQSHGEKRERVLDRLVGRLNEQGFDTTHPFPPVNRRHA